MQQRTQAQDATATVVRSGATLLKGVRVRQNTNDAPVLYVQIFNHASPNVGTTAPVHVLQVPAGSTKVECATLDARFESQFGGAYLATALSYAVTTTHDGSTNPDSGDEPVVIVDYEAVGA